MIIITSINLKNIIIKKLKLKNIYVNKINFINPISKYKNEDIRLSIVFIDKIIISLNFIDSVSIKELKNIIDEILFKEKISYNTMLIEI